MTIKLMDTDFGRFANKSNNIKQIVQHTPLWFSGCKSKHPQITRSFCFFSNSIYIFNKRRDFFNLSTNQPVHRPNLQFKSWFFICILQEMFVFEFICVHSPLIKKPPKYIDFWSNVLLKICHSNFWIFI